MRYIFMSISPIVLKFIAHMTTCQVGVLPHVKSNQRGRTTGFNFIGGNTTG
jgi:hypothetical protein